MKNNVAVEVDRSDSDEFHYKIFFKSRLFGHYVRYQLVTLMTTYHCREGLRAYNNENIVLRLPEDLVLSQITYISVWCRNFSVSITNSV